MNGLQFIPALAVLLVSASALAQQPLVRLAADASARTVLEAATQAAGGPVWAEPKTLSLAGHAVFYPAGTQEGAVTAEKYSMLRVFDAARTAAHGPEGLVRIDSISGGKVMFQLAFDGTDTWTQAGRMSEAEAAKTWANAFGFGIIRHALKGGFALTRLPDDTVDGIDVANVEITDPSGQTTQFSIAKDNAYILRVGFDTPRGWHERIYSDFYWLDEPGWLQPGRVRLFYNGVKSNEVFWTRTTVNLPLDPAAFTLAPPSAGE